MKYQYSSLIDPPAYDNEGLSNDIDLRKNDFSYLEDRGAIRAQHDWAKHVGPLKHFAGTLGPQWSFMSVSVPECIPSRLEIISYANEFAFMHDDVVEEQANNNGTAENDEMMKTFLQCAHGSPVALQQVLTKANGKTRMMAKMILEMFSIDRDCALVTMKAWAKFLQCGSSRRHETVFTTLDSYLPYRVSDVGEMFWYGVVTFGMGLSIPEHEMQKCRELMEPAWIAVSFANDVFSWPKERDAAERLGRKHVVNAVWILMNEHGISSDEATKMARHLSAQYVARYVEIVQRVKDDSSLSPDLRTYIEAMQFSISGNIVWSKTCPRYHAEQTFNERQLKWMDDGVPADNQISAPSTNKTSSSNGSHSSSPSERVSSNSSPASAELQQTEAHSKAAELSFCGDLAPLSLHVVNEPFEYVESLPSKGVRDMLVDAINHWLQLSDSDVKDVKRIINTLHTASLMLDDFQDNSDLRRGQPTAHRIFNAGQTVNSAMYHINECLKDVAAFAGIAGVNLALGQLSTLFVGQGQDLYSSDTLSCPSVTCYLQTIDGKTGALFELLAELMALKAPAERPAIPLSRLIRLLGRYFQIRDDYKNLTSEELTTQKGFCDDLEGGKYTLPLIHLLENSPSHGAVRNLLGMRMRMAQQRLSHDQKAFLLAQMERAGSLKYTRRVLDEIWYELTSELGTISEVFGADNPHMAKLVGLLRV